MNDKDYAGAFKAIVRNDIAESEDLPRSPSVNVYKWIEENSLPADSPYFTDRAICVDDLLKLLEGKVLVPEKADFKAAEACSATSTN